MNERTAGDLGHGTRFVDVHQPRRQLGGVGVRVGAPLGLVGRSPSIAVELGLAVGAGTARRFGVGAPVRHHHGPAAQFGPPAQADRHEEAVHVDVHHHRLRTVLLRLLLRPAGGRLPLFNGLVKK